MQRKQTATASGQDWAWIRANEKPGLVRCWIAQAYAFGSVFMAPHNQWCYTKDLGTHWWHGQPKDFGAIYRFVRNHAALLDGYKTLAKVGLVYSTGDYVRIRDTAHKLIEANVPFRLLFPGDRFSEESLYREALAACDVVLVADKAVELEGKRLVHLREKKELPEPIVNTVTVEGSDSIRVSLRGKPGDPSAPLVCHVLNQEYDAKTDRVLPVNIEIAFSKALLKQTGVRELPERGMAHSPGNESQAVAVTETDSNVSIHIQDAGLWTVVEF